MSRPTKEQVDDALGFADLAAADSAYGVLAAEVRALREDVVEVAKAAEDADAAYLAFEVIRGGRQDPESQALRLAMNVLRAALAPFTREDKP